MSEASKALAEIRKLCDENLGPSRSSLLNRIAKIAEDELARTQPGKPDREEAAQATPLDLCPYDGGETCLLEADEIGPCLCVNPVKAPAQEPWHLGTVLPPLEKGGEREFIVAVYRAKPDKVYSFSCSYLNAVPLNCDDCPKGNDWPGCEECTDDGCPFTGWFYLTGEDGDSGSYQALNIKEGDELRGWREIPKWEDRYAAPASYDATRDDEGVNGAEAIAKLREFDRFGLVIESAVRAADGPNWSRVSDLIKRTRVFMSILGPASPIRADRAVAADDREEPETNAYIADDGQFGAGA